MKNLYSTGKFCMLACVNISKIMLYNRLAFLALFDITKEEILFVGNKLIN